MGWPRDISARLLGAADGGLRAGTGGTAGFGIRPGDAPATRRSPRATGRARSWHQAARGTATGRGQGPGVECPRGRAGPGLLAGRVDPGLAGDDGLVVLRDVASGRVVGRLEGHRDAVSCLAFSPDGRTLATGSYDRTVKLWDVASGRERATLTGHTNWVFAVAFAPDGKALASAGHDKTVRIWDAATGRETATLPGPLGLGPGPGVRPGSNGDAGWPPAVRIAWS